MLNILVVWWRPSKTNNLDDNLENDGKNEEPKPLETSIYASRVKSTFLWTIPIIIIETLINRSLRFFLSFDHMMFRLNVLLQFWLVIFLIVTLITRKWDNGFNFNHNIFWNIIIRRIFGWIIYFKFDPKIFLLLLQIYLFCLAR